MQEPLPLRQWILIAFVRSGSTYDGKADDGKAYDGESKDVGTGMEEMKHDHRPDLGAPSLKIYVNGQLVAHGQKIPTLLEATKVQPLFPNPRTMTSARNLEGLAPREFLCEIAWDGKTASTIGISDDLGLMDSSFSILVWVKLDY